MRLETGELNETGHVVKWVRMGQLTWKPVGLRKAAKVKVVCLTPSQMPLRKFQSILQRSL